jgi:hypothetical protein
MPRPKPFTTYAARGKGGRPAKVPVLESAKNRCLSADPPFIEPPTREQLMAGSSNLRRVYKVEE